MKDPKAKWKVHDMISELISKEKDLLNQLTHVKPPSKEGCDWDLKIYDDYLKERELANKDGVGSEKWNNFLVKHIDYLANPSIRCKHK